MHTVIIPCFNEGNTIIKFLKELDDILGTIPNERFNVVVVNDSSLDDTLELLTPFQFKSLNVSFKLISLKYNVGHQKAIYQGILYAKEKLDSRYYIIIDGDGEDDPLAIKELVKLHEYDIVHVARKKRKENTLFRLSYVIYKIIFKFLTGKTMNFGNYSMINQRICNSVLDNSYVHFAAFLSKQKAKTTFIYYNRRKRIDGKSKMSFSNLLYHAFQSFIELGDSVVFMFLKLFLLLSVVFLILIVYVLYKKIFTDRAILGWASTLTSSLFSSMLVTLGFFIIGIISLNILSQVKNKKSENELFDVLVD